MAKSRIPIRALVALCAWLLGCAESLAPPSGGAAADAGADADPTLHVDTPECGAAAEDQASYGCDFFALRLDTEYGGGCFAVMVANSGTTPAHLALERAGIAFDVPSFTRVPEGQGTSLALSPYDAAAGLAAGGVALLFLSHAPGESEVYAPPCPVAPAVPGDPPVRGTGRGHAFRLRSDAPVSAYQVFPFGGGSAAETSATLLLPTHSFDRDYVAVNAYPQAYHGAPPTLAIVGLEEGTTVTVTPVADVLDGAPVNGTFVPGTPAGVARAYPLGAGEYLQFTQPAELTGSRVASDKPIGMLGGSTCLNVPTTECCCDTAQQQIPPLRAMGSEYVAVRHLDRAGVDDDVPWRFVGAADGTELTYQPAPPKGAPTTIARGEVFEVWAREPFVVRSQDKEHPFYVGAYMTGGGTHGVGDPEWVNVTPVGQYLHSYAFFTDPTYPETSLVVIRARSSSGQFSDVTLDCAGVIDGWQAVGDYEFTWVGLVTGDFESVGGCSNGAQHMESEGPFAVTVWGWGSPATGGNYPDPSFTQWVSYAYPAAAGVLRISEVPK
jgi:hypothetical protein